MRAPDLYRVLLWCYPAPFRREYGQEMLGAFHAELRDARRDGTCRQRRHLGPRAARPRPHRLPGASSRADAGSPSRRPRPSRQPGLHAGRRRLAGLGIGANTAIFSLLNNVLLATLPVREPQALVLFTDPEAQGVAAGSQSGERSLMTYQEFLDLQRGSTTLSSAMAASSSLHRVQARLDGAEPEEVALSLVSTSYFDTLGVPALIGRTFDGVTEPAEGSVPLAVISHELWQRRFGGRADVIGRALTLRDGAFQVIGVAPSWFFGETVGQRPDAWLPLANLSTILPGRPWLHDVPGTVEKVMWLHVFGRLRPAGHSRRRGGRSQRDLPAGAGALLRDAAGSQGAAGVPRPAPACAAGGERSELAE